MPASEMTKTPCFGVHFTTSIDLQAHPVLRETYMAKLNYYYVLDCIVTNCSDKGDKIEYTTARLEQYRSLLLGNTDIPNLDIASNDDTIHDIISDSTNKWKEQYWQWLLCDISLILIDTTAVLKSHKIIKNYLSQKQCALFDRWICIISGDKPVPATMNQFAPFIKQYQRNKHFEALPEKRFMITANMSAGKSTLINAIIGKPITRTSQEACTANLCYLHNKPFEDHAIHLSASPLNLKASYETLTNKARTNTSFIAAYFRTLIQPNFRVCIIDTPGVNSALNRDHASLTCKALAEEKYTKLIYVFNANKLGTDDEANYLKYISENVPKEKVIFVLNKLDEFKHSEDSIPISYVRLRNELLQLGYIDPILCPLSAYFALLIKRKQHGERLTEDEQDAYKFYAIKFSKPEYDLSQYYDNVCCSKKDSETMRLSKKCGLYGLENILWRN